MAFLLDTVTISAFRRPDKADARLVRWQESQRGKLGCISVITLNELRFGIMKVRSRDPVFATQLSTWYHKIISLPDHFPILNVNREIAELAAEYRADYGMTSEDALIAATARIHDLTLVTRNTSDFHNCDIRLINPWDFPG